MSFYRNGEDKRRGGVYSISPPAKGETNLGNFAVRLGNVKLLVMTL